MCTDLGITRGTGVCGRQLYLCLQVLLYHNSTIHIHYFGLNIKSFWIYPPPRPSFKIPGTLEGTSHSHLSVEEFTGNFLLERRTRTTKRTLASAGRELLQRETG